MTQTSPLNLLVLAASLGLSALACQSGGVGDPCIPEDEYRQSFNGYAVTEVNVESKSFQCETRVCIVNHFQGRASCPFGQLPKIIDPGADHKPPSDSARCRIPGTDGTHCIDRNDNNKQKQCAESNPAAGLVNIDEITVPVASQLVERSAQDTVYCSCRCDGPDPNARYCECPSGYECKELVKELGLPGKAQLAGSYCIKAGTEYLPQKPPGADTCYSSLVDPGHTESASAKYNLSQICGKAGVNP